MATAARRRPRRDAARSRTALIDAVGDLLAERRLDFSIPELAARADVGVATAYRHFATPSEALAACHQRAIEQLVSAFEAVDVAELTATQAFIRFCEIWVEQAMRWGDAVRHLRSHEGFLERLSAGDPAITALAGALDAVLRALADQGSLPPGDRAAATLLWITIFDERVVHDLSEQGWPARRITSFLTKAARGALGVTG